jgi:ribose 5-phosphate isomerase A
MRRAMPVEEAKRRAAAAAILELPVSGVLGLGSGSTARLFIEQVGELVRQGRQFQAVPTSEQSGALAAKVGIPLLSDDGPWSIDVTVDGADEVDPDLNLIKGGGGAHTREKIVNFASLRNVIIVDASKLSEHLGDKWPVPVEVLRFAHLATGRALARWGRPVLRSRAGQPVVTDTGNYIYDLHTGPIADVDALDCAVSRVPGVVETGLFVGRADLVLVSGPDDVRRLTRPLPPDPTTRASR